jgi:hypothetical protein
MGMEFFNMQMEIYFKGNFLWIVGRDLEFSYLRTDKTLSKGFGSITISKPTDFLSFLISIHIPLHTTNKYSNFIVVAVLSISLTVNILLKC